MVAKASETCSIDMADADDVVGFEIVVKAAGGAPVAHMYRLVPMMTYGFVHGPNIVSLTGCGMDE